MKAAWDNLEKFLITVVCLLAAAGAIYGITVLALNHEDSEREDLAEHSAKVHDLCGPSVGRIYDAMVNEETQSMQSQAKILVATCK